MPTNYRVQVVAQWHATDAVRDYTTNVLWYATNTTAASALGDAVKTAFTKSTAPYYYPKNVWVKVYDHAAPLHSPPVYTTQYSGAGSIALGPRQIALCLSFYSGLNIRGQRGRIYIGPWGASVLGEFATTAQMDQLIALAVDLKTPGGADVVHMIHHKTLNTFSNVSNYFVNNRWDTMRSRLPKETARETSP
jgi:hypothetical protein